MAAFRWTKRREQVALLLAQGYNQRETSEQTGISQRTVRRWYSKLEFAMEVDRLTLLTGISTRAERMRIVMQVVRQRITEKEGKEFVLSKRDILEWLKLAQSETDGAKLDLAPVFEALRAQTDADRERGEESSAEATTEANDAPLDTESRAADGGPPY